MSRTPSAVVAVALLALVATPLRAQDKPTADMLTAIAGTWTLDSARSDSVPPGLAALLNPQGARGPTNAGAAEAATGGRARRGGGGGGGAGMGGGRGAGGAGNLRVFLQEFSSLPTMVLGLTATTAVTADAGGFETTWKTDGKKHPVAQMEGGVIEFFGGWRGKVLTLEKTIPNNGSVRRDFKPLPDGALEVKVTLALGNRKLDQKVVYVRAADGK